MISKATTTVVLALLVASTSAGLARAPRVTAWTCVRGCGVQLCPARMIEVRPGLWVGSYQYVTDLDRGGRDCSSGI
jgi:hypothetical protein